MDADTRHATICLIEAVKARDVDKVKQLIPLSDPTFENNLALQHACWNGDVQCTQLLIPVSNPKNHDSMLLRVAIEHERTAIVDLLYPVSDPCVVLKYLQKNHGEDVWGELQQRIKADQERAILQQHVGNVCIKGHRKI